jgi:hypothetical protein
MDLTTRQKNKLRNALPAHLISSHRADQIRSNHPNDSKHTVKQDLPDNTNRIAAEFSDRESPGLSWTIARDGGSQMTPHDSSTRR